jgi:hypothetical protein
MLAMQPIVEVLGAGSSLAADFWATSRMLLAGLHGGLERLDRLRAPDEQRDHHVREHHHVPQGQQRQFDAFFGEVKRA